MLFFILLLVMLIFANTRLARKKGKKPFVWGMITFAAFFLCYFLMGSIYLAIIYKGPLTREALTAYLVAEPLAVVMLTMLGVGGFLIVRFILERSKTSDTV